MSDDRYQFQPFHVRCYRWWRHMPIGYALALFWSLVWWGYLFWRWISGNWPPFPAGDHYNKLALGEVLTMAWTPQISRAHHCMQWYWHAREIFGKLRDEAERREAK